MGLPADTEAWVRALTLLPIFVCSIVGAALTATKWLQIRRSRNALEHVLGQVRALVGAREFGRALAVVRGYPSHSSRFIELTLAAAEAPRGRLPRVVEQAGRAVARELDYGIGGVGLIATLGPLLGLLGTVVGIVLVFGRLAAAQGVVSPDQLAGGIGTALYTTVAGLIVGMCALVSHRILAAGADRVTGQLEVVGQELVDLIEEGAA